MNRVRYVKVGVDLKRDEIGYVEYLVTITVAIIIAIMFGLC